MLLQNTPSDVAYAAGNGNARRMHLPDYLLMQAGSAQLSFAVNNGDVENTIYITADPDVNKLSFVITTNVDDTTFSPGTIVPISQAPQGTGSLLYLNLSNLQLSQAEFDKLEISANGWTFQKYAPATIAMTPTETIVINNTTSSSITINIDKLTLATPPTTPNADLHVSAFRTPPVTADNKLPGVYFFKVLLQQVPDGKKNLYESIDVALTGDPYIINSIPNGQFINNISFVLKPGSTPATVLAGKDTRFFVSFVYASARPGYGAITTPANAANIKVKQGQNAGDWSISSDTGSQNPAWQLIPPEGLPIIGTGVKSVVEFNIGNIITDFEPGPTLMFVQYENVPGYNDGSYYILLNKSPHVVIHSFEGNPNPAYLDENGKARIRLTWTVDHVGTLMLYPSLVNVTGLNYLDVDIENTASFTLSAMGRELSNKGNMVSKPLQVTVLPKVNSFIASPQNIYYKSFPGEVALSWNVSTGGGKIRLISSITGESPYSFNAVGSVDQTINEPQMLTLVPDGEKNPIFHRSVVLSAFKVSSNKHNIGVVNSLIALLPTGNVFFTIDFNSKELNAINTIDLKSACPALSLADGLSALAISPDGKYLYVTNSKEKNVSVIKVENTPGAFSMSLLTTIPDVGVDPVDIAVSPLGDQLYVVDTGGSNGSLVVINENNGTYSIAATVELENKPQYLAVNPSGEYIFITNSGSNTLTVVSRTGTDSFEIAKTIPTGKTPTGVCASPDGEWIFVSNTNDNNVMVISATKLAATSTLLSTGKGPIFLSITPSSDYLFVSSKIDKNITLIGKDNRDGKYKVLDSAISSGAEVWGTSISPNGHQVFAAGGSSKDLSVLTLGTYESTPPITPKITSPTSTAVSKDNRKVALWARPSINTKREQGINLIDVKTQTITPVMIGLDIYDVVYSPDKKLVFVIQGKNDVLSLHARSVSGFTDFHTIDGFSGVPNRLAVTTDGKKLVVAVSEANSKKDNALVIIDTGDFSVLQTIILQKAEGFTSIPVAITPNDDKIFAVQNDKVSVLKKDGEAYVLESKQADVGEQSNVIGILPDGSKAIVVASESHSIAVIDTAHYDVQVYEIPDSYSNFVSGLAISPDGSNIVVSDTQGGQVLMLDTLTYSVFSRIPVAKFPQYLSYLLDGSALYVPNMLSNSVSVVRQIQPVSATEHITHKPDSDGDTYEGMYIRKYLNQSGPIPSGDAVTMSPDIIPWGDQLKEHPDEFITQENWDKDLAKEVLSAQYNNLYIRGNSNGSAKEEKELALNWSPSNLVMWPNNWADNRIPLNGKPGIFTQKVSAEPNSKWVTGTPYQWNVPQLPPEADHFCLVALLDEPVPTTNFDWNGLIAWIKKPNVGWRNVYPVKRDTPSWQRQFLLNLPDDGKIPEKSKVYVFLDFAEMPAGVDVAFSCPDQQAEPLIIKPRVQLKEPNEVIGIWTKLPRGFSSYVTVSFWKNNVTVPVGASVTLNIYYTPATMTDDEFSDLCDLFHGQERMTHDFLKANLPAPWYYVGACHNVNTD